jgi:virginiamycin B lyase
MLQQWRKVSAKSSKPHFYRCAVALALGFALLTLTTSPASAGAPRLEWASGSVSCSFSGTVKFSPPLTLAGGGTRRSNVKATLSGCKTYGPIYDTTVHAGRFFGSFAQSPIDCKTLSVTGASMTALARWANGDDHGPARFHQSVIDHNIVDGSFGGTARVALDPSTPASVCATGKVRSATVTGTLTLGPSCGPGTTPLTTYPIAAGPMCGGAYNPLDITAGPDGALWFTNNISNTIGRITTSGVVTLFPLAANSGAGVITAGPDGALWFTTSTGIGRISTSGAVTVFPVSGEVDGITAGPDGALWFFTRAVLPNGTQGTTGQFIGRMTISGAITKYTDPGIGPDIANITAGPDGALWFTNLAGNSIGRITTTGVVTTYSGPSIQGPIDITPGPDGALWFVNWSSSIGRITTSGVMTSYGGPKLNGVQAVTAGPDGAIWFANYSGPSSVGRMTTSGVVTNYYTDPSIDLPWIMTAGPDDAVWFTNSGNDTIGRIAVP